MATNHLKLLEKVEQKALLSFAGLGNVKKKVKKNIKKN
jgi:hypothetical protein